MKVSSHRCCYWRLPPPVRPSYNDLPQMLTSDTTSDVSLQTIPSAFNVLVNTRPIGHPPPKLDPPPLPSSSNSIPPSNNLITTQPSSSQSPLRYNTPSKFPHR